MQRGQRVTEWGTKGQGASPIEARRGLLGMGGGGELAVNGFGPEGIGLGSAGESKWTLG